MVDTIEMFKGHWDAECNKRKRESPSYSKADYVVTGRAAAKYGGKRSEAWWLEQGPVMVDKFIEWRKASDWVIWETPHGFPAIELELKPTLPGMELPILMFIDTVFVTGAGEMVVCDYKTGRIPETPEQLGLYATGLEYTYDIRPTWGTFYDAQKGVTTGFHNLDDYDADYFRENYEMASRGINAGVFMAKPANGCRAWCGVAKYCKAVGGTLPVVDIAGRQE